MIEVRSVEQVRAAEERAFAQVPEGSLMQRAAFALAVSTARLLDDLRGGVAGSRVVLLVGSGNNGGDALWAGAMLADRGCRVDAVCVADRWHAEGAAALAARGGRLHRWDGSADLAGVIADADVVLDGILGIGGSGPLRAPAAEAVGSIDGAAVIAVDVPSGVDADTGLADATAVRADLTVTFGAAKPGLLVAPGRLHSGLVHIIDIGLQFDDEPAAVCLEEVDAAAWFPEPAEADYKYSRGVVGLAVGSALYRGAALLATAAARHANVGMVRLLDRADGVGPLVVGDLPDVVIDGAAPVHQTRADAWACGSGFPGTADDEATVLAVLDTTGPVVLDAGALTVVAESAEVRRRVAGRSEAGLVTVLTPHEGEFARLQPDVDLASTGRIAAALVAAAELHCIVVLKGPGTVVAAPSGAVFLDTEGTPALATAGSGDVLTGILGSVLAGAWATSQRDDADLVEAVAAGVWLHGCAGRLAETDGAVTATDIAGHVGAAVNVVRFGGAA